MRRCSFRLLMLLVMPLIVALALDGCAQAPASTGAEPVVLKFASNEVPSSPDVTQYIIPWLDEIEKRSGGKVKIERHWSETLVSMPDTYKAVVDGAVDMAMFLPSMVSGKFPIDEVQRLTPMDLNVWRPSRVYWDLYQGFPEMQAQYKEVKFLGGTADTASILAVNKAINRLEDNKGLKMAAAGRIAGERGKALGWTIVPVPPFEVYSSLEKGIIDGLPTQAKNLVGMKWGEVTKYVVQVPIGRAYQAYIMNLDKYNSLPSDVRKVLDELGGQYLADLADKARRKTDDELSSKLPTEMNMKVIELAPVEIGRWSEAVKPVDEKFVGELESSGLPGRKLLEEYLSLCEKYSAEEYSLK